MAVSAQKTRVMSGKFPLSCYATAVTSATSRAMLDTTTLCDDAQTFIKGVRSASLTVETIVDNATTADNYWDTLTGFYAAGTEIPLTVSPEGIAVNSAAIVGKGFVTNFAPASTVGDKVTASLTFTVNGRTSFDGRNLVAHSAITTNTTGTTVDGGAASANGALANLHITAASGTSPTLDVVVEHSTNNSTWATLGTFAQATGTGGESIVIAGPTVNRYVRSRATTGGTNPSFTIAVAVARL